MSEKKKIPEGLGATVVAFGLGLAMTGACLAGAAWLMVRQELTQGVVWPLSTAAVCMGSLFSGWLAALLCKKRGLVRGSVQGVLFAGSLLLLTPLSEGVPAEKQLLRMALAILFGAVGGFLGMLCSERKRRRT